MWFRTSPEPQISAETWSRLQDSQFTVQAQPVGVDSGQCLASGLIDTGVGRRTREQKMLEGCLSSAIYHQVYIHHRVNVIYYQVNNVSEDEA